MTALRLVVAQVVDHVQNGVPLHICSVSQVGIEPTTLAYQPRVLSICYDDNI